MVQCQRFCDLLQHNLVYLSHCRPQEYHRNIFKHDFFFLGGGGGEGYAKRASFQTLLGSVFMEFVIYTKYNTGTFSSVLTSWWLIFGNSKKDILRE